MLQCRSKPHSNPDWSLCALYKISRALDATLDAAELLDRVLDSVVEITRAQRGLVLLSGERQDEFEVVAAHQADERTIQDAVERSRQLAAENGPELSLDVLVAERDNDEHGGPLWSPLCLPLRSCGRLIGTLYLDHPQQAGHFPPGFLPFYAALADQIALAVENARLYSQLREENVHLRKQVEEHHQFANILGDSKPMRRMKALLEKVIQSPAPVLIVGESGTGKEVVARAIHYEGPRKKQRFVAENCAALPEALLESELFGHARGAYTGADQDKQGLFEVADGGTLFLDEIVDTSTAVQAKLLRALESGEIRRLGDTEPRPVQVRIVTATSRDLLQEMEAGRFRPELYYRLSVLTVRIPPLRERPDDIPLLATHFLQDYAGRTLKNLPGFDQEVMDALVRYQWPGNVRELRNEVERMAALVDVIIF